MIYLSTNITFPQLTENEKIVMLLTKTLYYFKNKRDVRFNTI